MSPKVHTQLNTDLTTSAKTFPYISSQTEYKSILVFVKHQVNDLNNKSGYFLALGSVTDVPDATTAWFVRYQSDVSGSNFVYLEVAEYTSGATEYYAVINRNSTSTISWTKRPLRTEIDTLNTTVAKAFMQEAVAANTTILAAVKARIDASPTGYFTCVQPSDGPESSKDWLVKYYRPYTSNSIYITATDIFNDEQRTYHTAITSSSTSITWTKEANSADFVIEVDNVPTFTAAANAATALTLTHTKSGYSCWFLSYFEYRTSNAWFTHAKDLSLGQAIIDIVNTSNTDFTTTTARAVWLCVRN